MSKQIVISVVLALTSGLVLAACGGSGDAEPARAEPAVAPRVPSPEPEPLPPRDHTSLAATAPAVLPGPTTSLATTQSPAPTVAPAPAREDGRGVGRAEVSVRRLVVTRGIAAREPIDEIDVLDDIAVPERVFAFVDAANPGDRDGEIEVTFERADGFVTGMVRLEVPARAGRHRTWAFSRGVRTAGEWRAVVRDEAGRVLAEQPFTVE